MTIQTLRCPHSSAPLTRDAQGKDPTECQSCHSALTTQKLAFDAQGRLVTVHGDQVAAWNVTLP